MKQCFKCAKTLPISEFYGHSAMRDGHLNKCKACTRKAVSDNYYANHAAKLAWERQRNATPERRAARLRYQATRRKRFPDKTYARYAVSNAIRDGRLDKPSACPHCGSTDRIQAHHHDYSKPLDVEWACFKCHREKFHSQRCAA